MDYIFIPEWITKDDFENSTFIYSLISKCEINDSKIDLEYLRKYFTQDREFFQNVVDEMAIRGFSFICSKPNNILPKIEMTYPTLIKINENNNNFANIDFELLGLPDFVYRFSVKSDLFFNNIPIEGFLHLNRSIDLEMLANKFHECGFDILKFKKFDDNEMKISRELLSQSIEDLNLSVRSKNCLKKNNINKISDLLNFDRETISSFKNMGEKSIDEVMMLISSINENGDIEINNTGISEFEEMNFSVRARNALESIGIRTMEELILITSEDIRHITNVGAKTADEIINRIDKWKKENNFDEKIRYEYIELDEEIVSCFGEYKYNQIDCTLPHVMLTIKELQHRIINDLFHKYGKEEAILITNKVKKLNTLKKIISNLNMETRDIDILSKRFVEGYTLEEAGESFELTRERVRQIQAKAEKKVINTLKNEGFFWILNILNKNKTTCRSSFIKSSICDDELLYNLLEKSKLSPLTYNESLDVFFLEKYDNFLFEVETLLKNKEDCFGIIDLIDEILLLCEKYDIDNIGINNIEELLKANGYFLYGELVSNHRISTMEIINILFRDFIEADLRLDDDGLKFCKKLAEENLGYYSLPSNYRGLDSRVRNEVEELLLVGKSTFKHISKIDYDPEIIKSIEEYLERIFETQDVVTMKEVLSDNACIIKDTILNNKYLLYSLLKKEFGDKFIFGKKNTLNIYSSSIENRLSMREMLISYLNDRDGRAHKDDICNELGWSSIRLENTIASCKDFISVGNRIIKLAKDLTFTNEESNILDSIIKQNLKGDFFGVQTVFLDLKFNIIMNDFMNRNEIENPLVLSQILKMKYPNFVGHSAVLFNKNSKYRRIEDVIYFEYPITTKDDVKKLLCELGYSDLAAYSILSKLLNSKKFVEISENEIVRFDKFIISNTVLEDVNIYFEDLYCENEFLALKSISGYRRSLPSIQYRWNPYLLKTILLSNDYKKVSQITTDYRTDRLLLVKKNSKINTLEDLCICMIENKYRGNMHESKVYEFLSSLGILVEKDNRSNKRLPLELRNGKNIFVDEVGKVVLR